MSAAPYFKVFCPANRYRASCHEPEAAAALCNFYGPGSTIRCGHVRKYTLYTHEYSEDSGDLASYDEVAEKVYAALTELRAKFQPRP